MNYLKLSSAFFIILIGSNLFAGPPSDGPYRFSKSLREGPNIHLSDNLDDEIRRSPKDARLFRRRAEALMAKGEFAKATLDLTEAIRLDRTDTESLRMRGYAFAELGQIAKAVNDLGDAIRLDPGSDEAYACRGWVRTLAGDVRGAIDDLNVAIELNQECSLYYVHRGEARQKVHEYDLAVSDFSRAISFHDAIEVEACFCRAKSYLAAEKAKEALADLNRAIVLRPEAFEYLLERSEAWRRLGDDEKRKTDLRDGYFARGRELVDARDFGSALADFDRIAEYGPKTAMIAFWRSRALRGIGREAEGLRELEEAIRLDPTFIQAYVVRASLFALEQNYDEALALANSAVRLVPNDAKARMLRAHIRRSTGEREGAVEDAEAAIKVDPDDVDAFCFLAFWLATDVRDEFRSGQRAVELAMRACEITTWQNSECLETLAVALAEKGEYREAKERLRQAIALSPHQNARMREKLMSNFENGKPIRYK